MGNKSPGKDVHAAKLADLEQIMFKECRPMTTTSSGWRIKGVMGRDFCCFPQDFRRAGFQSSRADSLCWTQAERRQVCRSNSLPADAWRILREKMGVT